MSTLAEFSEKYQKTITLKNELIPVGKTLENFKNEKILEKDELLKTNSKKLKDLMMIFFRKIIDDALTNIDLDFSKLGILLEQDDSKKIKTEQENLRKKISEILYKLYDVEIKKTKSEEEKKQNKKPKKSNKKETEGKKISLSSKDIILAISYMQNISAEDKQVLENFKNFTTYFEKFIKNIENVFSNKGISTSVSNRIVNENFPKFVANISIFKKWQSICPQCIESAKEIFIKNNMLPEGLSLEEVFSIKNFNKILSQKGIDSFNQLLSGKAGEKHVQGLNEIVNLSLQKDNELKDKLKKARAIKLNPLYKQILSDKEKTFFIDEFKSDEEVILKIKEYFDVLFSKNDKSLSNIESLTELFNHLSDYETDKIFVSGKRINLLSKWLYGGFEWDKIRTAIVSNVKLKKDDLDQFISSKEFALSNLNKFIDNEYNKKDLLLLISNKFKSLLGECIKDKALVDKLSQNIKEDKAVLKKALDSLHALFDFSKIFVTEANIKDNSFYYEYESLLKEFKPIVKLYDKVRNYVTKKPYSIEKIKLNFGSSTLAKGWSQSKESVNLSLLFEKDGFYYLGILNNKFKTGNKQILNKLNSNSEEDAKSCYRKICYSVLDFNKNFKRISAGLKVVKGHFEKSKDDFYIENKSFKSKLKISYEVFEYINAAEKKELDENNPKLLKQVIDFVINFIDNYKSCDNFDLSLVKKNRDNYKSYTDLINDIDSYTYKISFVNVSENYINYLIDNNKLFLYQISNKDFKAKSYGKMNLHTLYFLSLFDQSTLPYAIRLNGNAELFYRYKSLDSKKVTHKKNSCLVNKTYLSVKDNSYKSIPENIYNEIYRLKNGKLDYCDLSDKSKKFYLEHEKEIVFKTADYDIQKDKRFTEDKFSFNCPIAINFNKKSDKFNDKVESFLKENKDINIIGIDRGERNLLYVTVINQKGEILLQKSLNNLSKNLKKEEKTLSIDFNEKLYLREQERNAQKRSWESISKISDLKKGYLSGIIHQLSKMMIEYNAIIVLENLNFGFKRIRGGISEKSVYQQFEKALIDKLNYLVFKDSKWTDKGGVLNGYQLTDQIKSFSKIGNQTGFIFYVPAAYTSKIDPTTGFANVFNFHGIESKESIHDFFSKFSEIRYLKEDDLFVFKTDLSKFSCKADFYEKNWDIFSYGNRILKKKNKDTNKYIDVKNYSPTDELKKLLDNYLIDYSSGNNLISCFDDKKLETIFFTKLLFIFKNILQLRNSSSDGEDYLISPVKHDMDGKKYFFNSNDSDEKLPKDADANGAYHIALKGLMLLEQINKNAENLKITNKDWFEFTQTRFNKK